MNPSGNEDNDDPSLSPNTLINNNLAFPMRLHEMIKWIEDNYPNSSRPIYWLRSGRAFMIQDHDELGATILPKFFNQSKIESFTRKLNRWGFNIIRSGPDRGAYMHKDFVRWEEPLSITSMSKDTNRKRRFSLRKVGISAEEIWEPKKDIKPQIIEVIRKVPPPNENCKKKCSDLKQSSEVIDLGGKDKLSFTASCSRSQSCSYQDYKNAERLPSQPHGNTNRLMLNASAGGCGSRRFTTYQQSWNECLLASNGSESHSNAASWDPRCVEQCYHWDDHISLNRFSTHSSNEGNLNNSSLNEQSFDSSYDAYVAKQSLTFPPAQPWEISPMVYDDSNTATRNIKTTSFGDVKIANNIDNSIQNITCMTSSIHSSGARNFRDFTPGVDNMHAAVSNFQALEVQQPMNFPPAQPGQAPATVSVNNNIANNNINTNTGNASTAIKDINIATMTRADCTKTGMNNNVMTTNSAQSNLALHGFGEENMGNIILDTNKNDSNGCSPDVYTEDFLSSPEIFSLIYDRDFAEGQKLNDLTTPAAAAVNENEDCKNDTKATVTTGTAETVDVDQINRDLEEYLEQLEESFGEKKENVGKCNMVGR